MHVSTFLSMLEYYSYNFRMLLSSFLVSLAIVAKSLFAFSRFIGVSMDFIVNLALLILPFSSPEIAMKFGISSSFAYFNNSIIDSSGSASKMIS